MGFSLKRAFKKVKKFAKKGLKLADKATLGMFTAGQTGGTLANSLMKKAGLAPGDVPNLEKIKNKAELEEAIKLAALEKEKRAESKFMGTEGQGLRRKSELSFGNADVESANTSLSTSGRFDTNRLVL